MSFPATDWSAAV